MISVPNSLERAATLLNTAERVVVFTGAGVSRESGIPTFRDVDGVWSRYPADQFATPAGLLATWNDGPERVAEFLLEALEPLISAEPNAGHHAIAALDAHCDVVVVTQNIDGLHSAAGSRTVYEVHGTTYRVVTGEGEPLARLTRDDLRGVARRLRHILATGVTEARILAALRKLLGFNRSGMYRPNVVLFGEALCEPDWSFAQEAAEHCDVMVTVGTSEAVYPAAMLPASARNRGTPVIRIDPVGDPEDSESIWLEGTAAEMMPALAARAFGESGP